MSGFVNALDRRVAPGHTAPSWEPLPAVHPSAGCVHRLAAAGELGQLTATLAADWQPVSITGMGGNYRPGDRIGSYRASLYDPDWAQVLFARLRPLLPDTRRLGVDTGVAEELDGAWEPVGVNPLLRLVRYEDDGMLVPHYDGPYVADDTVRTLTSLVLYVHRGPGVTGGATRFLRDDQAHLPATGRQLGDRVDWVPGPGDVRYAANPAPGDALLFDHRILHDSELVTGGTKLILRTDVLYRRLP